MWWRSSDSIYLKPVLSVKVNFKLGLGSTLFIRELTLVLCENSKLGTSLVSSVSIKAMSLYRELTFIKRLGPNWNCCDFKDVLILNFASHSLLTGNVKKL